MAGSARGRRRGHVCSGKGEPGYAMIESGRSPAGGRMASGAVCRGKGRAGSRVDRRSRLLPGGQVALRIATSCRGDRQTVVVVDVAGGASHAGVPLREQESGGAMVECRRRPADRVVAGRAARHSKGRAGGRVRGVVGLLPGGQMALRIAAIGRSDRQIVIVVDMAERARHIRMAIGEQKSGRTVIELCVQPIVE